MMQGVQPTLAVPCLYFYLEKTIYPLKPDLKNVSLPLAFCALAPSSPERCCVMIDMVFDKRGNEEITVIITCLETQGQWMTGILAGLLQQYRFELAAQEIIVLSLVHQDVEFFLGFRDQGTGIVFLPVFTVVTDVVG